MYYKEYPMIIAYTETSLGRRHIIGLPGGGSMSQFSESDPRYTFPFSEYHSR